MRNLPVLLQKAPIVFNNFYREKLGIQEMLEYSHGKMLKVFNTTAYFGIVTPPRLSLHATKDPMKTVFCEEI